MAVAGELDPTFGGDGTVTTNFFRADFIRDAAVQPDGKTVVVGTASTLTLQPIVARYKLNGSLDSSFGSNGRVLPSLVFDPSTVLIQPNGKILVGGWLDGSFSVIRLNPDGSFDSAFGTGGVATIRFLPSPSDERINDMALQPDGKIVAVGDLNGSEWFAVGRFNSDGTPDATFGDQGRVRPGMGPSVEEANAVVIQSDLKIVVGGEVFHGATGIDFALARFHPNGQLDGTFGDGGRTFTNFNNLRDSISCLALQPDGKILAGGNTFQPDGNDQKSHFGLARYETNGNLDLSFEADGKVITGFSGNVVLEEIVLQPDGKIVAAGSGFANPSGSDHILTRYNSTGTVDNTFGNLGTVITDFGGSDSATTLVLQPDNKIVVAGAYTNLSDGTADFALARYSTAATNAPVLQVQGISTNAVALDSVTFVRDPFPITSDHNFSADHQTRVTLLATNLTLTNGENSSAVSVQAQLSGGAIHTLPVEYVGEVPGFEWLTQVVVRLPPQVAGAGTVQVSITHGNTSNQSSVVIN